MNAIASSSGPRSDERRRFTVVLVKPSKYDDDGYVIRHWRGILPSNTLAVLRSLTVDAARRRALGDDVALNVLVYDETVHRIDPSRIAQRAQAGGACAVICLCGVQTNQFPRAADLALQFRGLGLPVMIGGFHTSGVMELFPSLTPELQEMIDAGVTLVRGEIEACWTDLLRDAWSGELKPRYDVHDRPDLSIPPVPLLDHQYMKRFIYPRMQTIDAGRGCPFNCSFCTIINVQGRRMRNRVTDDIERIVRDNWRRKIDYYFFTDDNFARNRNWEEIFDALIRLREQEGIRIDFLMQVDTLAWKIPRFVEKAARAGSCQVFIGMESIRRENLKAAAKTQNQPRDYAEMIQTWHRHGIACQVGYILGFPSDTADTIAEDVAALLQEIKVDLASFFILTPFPGSRDHLELARAGTPMLSDLNQFDSFHVVTEHPRMTAETWLAAYRRAWRTFYSLSSMRAILERADSRTYWNLFKNLAWYRMSMIEGAHPYITGVLRLKDRKQRRRGCAIESPTAHLRRRAPEMFGYVRQMLALGIDMTHLWVQTRHASRRAAAV